MLVQVNTRFKKSQRTLVRNLAEELGMKHGEVWRMLVDEAIQHRASKAAEVRR